MSVLKIREFPDPVLRGETQPVTKFDDELKTFVQDMWDTMYQADGVGLAAPQVGDKRKIIVINYREEKYVLINPVITESSGEAEHEEGCLSFPGLYEKVTSPDDMIVKYFDENGEPHEKHATEFLACVFSHEIDHLSGRLLIDRVSPIKKSFMKKKMENRKRGR